MQQPTLAVANPMSIFSSFLAHSTNCGESLILDIKMVTTQALEDES